MRPGAVRCVRARPHAPRQDPDGAPDVTQGRCRRRGEAGRALDGPERSPDGRCPRDATQGAGASPSPPMRDRDGKRQNDPTRSDDEASDVFCHCALTFFVTTDALCRSLCFRRHPTQFRRWSRGRSSGRTKAPRHPQRKRAKGRDDPSRQTERSFSIMPFARRLPLRVTQRGRDDESAPTQRRSDDAASAPGHHGKRARRT